MSPRDPTWQSPARQTGLARPGPRNPRAGLAPWTPEIPRAFREVDDSISDQRDRWSTSTEGAAPAFRPSRHLEHLCRGADAHRPRSGPPTISAARYRGLVAPCGASSGTTPGCLESASTTDVHVTSTRVETPLLETFRRTLWETRQPSTSGPSPGRRRLRRFHPRTAPDHLAVIRTSSGLALDGATPASGRFGSPCPRDEAQVGDEAPQRYRLTAAPPKRTL
jgi:hypothetical protein